MKKILFLSVFLTSVFYSYAQVVINNEEQEIYTVVESMPSWIGCEKEQNENKRTQCTYDRIQNYIKKNLKYPAVSRQQKLEGTVYVKFVIDNNGEAKDTEVVDGLSQELNDEAIRLIANMPKWNPGVQKGKTVDVQYNIPVKFTLENPNTEPEVFTIVENMPAWKGCEKIKSQTSKLECSQNKINEYLAKSIIYPVNSKNNGIGGTVYVTFIISKEGKISNPKILRGVTEDLDKEALRVVAAMPDWIPGTQNGFALNVQYNLPVKFTLR